MQSILLLHGALGASQDLEPIAEALKSEGIQAHAFSFSGHGKTAFDNAFGVPQFTRELEDFIREQELDHPPVFGYSMGGYVALNLALRQDNPLGNIITLGTKFNWSRETVEKETEALDPERIVQKVPAFAATLKTRHGEAWRELVLKTADLMRGLQALDLLNPVSFKTIQNKVLLGIGDRDKMVSLDETVQVYKSLPNAAMYMLPDTRHPVESCDAKLLSKLIGNFIRKAD